MKEELEPMKLLRLLTVVALGWGAPTWAAPPLSAYHVVVPQKALAAGEQVEVRLEPAPPPGTYIYWRTARSIGMNPIAVEADRAVYTAPLVIPTGSPPADIRVDLSGAQTGRVGFVAHVNLVPSAVVGSADCLAPGQTYSPEFGTIEPQESSISLATGVVVHMGDPDYPKEAVRRGLTDV